MKEYRKINNSIEIAEEEDPPMKNSDT